jgi:phosphoglycerol transferase MdoB-like AlkP superfamily enzyme
MNFDAFAKKAEFDDYFGMNEYENSSDFDGHWGIYDEPFMQYVARSLSSAPKPFFATFFSLSSHPPFSIPTEYQQKFKSVDTDKHRSFLYTDQALRKFFDYAKTKKWFYNTLFVIMPDHTPDADDKYYDTKVSYYKIPIIFYDPSRDWKGKSTKIASQIDVMPSILDYLHFDQPFKSFGKSLWTEDSVNYSINYRDGVYQLIDSSFVLQYADDNVTALYNYNKDWYLTNNLKDIEVIKRDQMKKVIEAYIQKFNVTLIKNNYAKP